MTLTNIYPIENLSELSCDYRLYRVLGLSDTSDEYDKNCQKLLDTLRTIGSCPAAIVKSDGELLIAQPVGYKDFQKEVELVRAQAIIEPLKGIKKLDFGNLAGEEIGVGLQFLKFAMEGSLFKIDTLWRPSAGLPFFHKIPDPEFSTNQSEADLYRGFRFRLGVLPENRIGIAVDTSYKYLSSRIPLRPCKQRLLSENQR